MLGDLRFRSDDNFFELRAVGIIVHRPAVGEPHVLMVTSSSFDYAYSVGGAVGFGETTREAAAREVEEETGHRLEIGALAAVEEALYNENGRESQIVGLYYWVEVDEMFTPSGESLGTDGEQETLRWFSLSDLDSISFYPSFYRDALLEHWPGIWHSVEQGGEVTILRA
ncbi:MAG: NUDIX domain-containing protein [Propionibacteriaceae bacterium]|nr:NUDIX domain-containing protein [Propionibacteriaceae bacterium]